MPLVISALLQSNAIQRCHFQRGPFLSLPSICLSPRLTPYTVLVNITSKRQQFFSGVKGKDDQSPGNGYRTSRQTAAAKEGQTLNQDPGMESSDALASQLGFGSASDFCSLSGGRGMGSERRPLELASSLLFSNECEEEGECLNYVPQTLNVAMLCNHCSVAGAASDINLWCSLCVLTWLQESDAVLNAYHWGMIQTNKHKQKQQNKQTCIAHELLQQSDQDDTQLLSAYNAYLLSFSY